MLIFNLFSFHSSPSLPALDWQLPSHSGPYELRIEVQPKSHHRAHYETEGSRGAVKASAGGHPIVQVPNRVMSSPGCLSLCSVASTVSSLKPKSNGRFFLSSEIPAHEHTLEHILNWVDQVFGENSARAMWIWGEWIAALSV